MALLDRDIRTEAKDAHLARTAVFWGRFPTRSVHSEPQIRLDRAGKPTFDICRLSADPSRFWGEARLPFDKQIAGTPVAECGDSSRPVAVVESQISTSGRSSEVTGADTGPQWEAVDHNQKRSSGRRRSAY